MADDASLARAAQQRPGILAAGLLVAGVVPFMAGLLGLYALLGVGMPYVGFFFLLYWAGILHQDLSEFLPALMGSAGGLALGWLLLTLPVAHGLAGQAAAGLILAAILFCFMRGHLRMLCNNAMMLFLIVGTIPDLHADKTIAQMLASLAIGAGYMGAIAILIHGLRAVFARRNENTGQ
ncbi:MAG: hypothetical protein CMH85_17425 [Novosphingobium sp.]|nr:hypothetical protein [Novosphingobium sp.]